MAYSTHLQLDLLQETTDEMARNGCKKVLIVNGHGGNERLLPVFAQSQMEKPQDYGVYVLGRLVTPPDRPGKKTKSEMLSGESKTIKRPRAGPALGRMAGAGPDPG